MALYSYKGLDSKGAKTAGRMEAEDEKAAVRRLREQSIFVLKIREGAELGGDWNILSALKQGLGWLRPRRFLPVGAGDLILFFQQISLMLRAGYTLVPALNAARGMHVKLGMINAIDRMSAAISTGASFSSSMAAEKRRFPPMVVNLVAIGERSGNLDSILDRLAENLERTRELKRQLLSAMLYPTIVLLGSVALVVYMVMKIIPRFAVFLTARGSALPRSTQLLLDVSDWALDWGRVMGIVLGVGTFLVLAAYTTRRGKKAVDRVVLALPIVGTAVQYGAMAQTGWSLSLCLRSGLPALDALRVNGAAMGNLAIGESFEKAADGLLVGRALSKTIEQPFIPLMVRHMAAVGEKSGELDTVMDDMGRHYQRELAAKVKVMSIMIEPVMILMVGGLVGFVYFSMFQAVLSVSKGGM